MLARLAPELLDRVSFPLGGLTKDSVRRLARDSGLPVADKRESQDLCFVAGLGGRAFLRRHGGPRLRGAGQIVDRDGRVLGRHEGQHEFTVGQRRGLGVHSTDPLYVLSKDAASGTVTVGPREALTATTVELDEHAACTGRRTPSRASGCATTPGRCAAGPARPAPGPSSSTSTNRPRRSPRASSLV